MAIFKSLTFDGINSLDYGIYISGEAVYNAPERAVDMVVIPGKNGALAIDQGRFENIEVTYHAGCFADSQADFADKVMKFRNALASRFVYKRLTDGYHTDEYRMALYKSGLELSPVRYSTASEFDITFDCKPQRFLVDGDRAISPTEWHDIQTATGELVTIESDGSLAVKALEVSLSPIQDLHGYDKPWVGGAGKNKLPMTLASLKAVNTATTWGGNTYTINGITFTVLTDANDNVTGIRANGTATAEAMFFQINNTKLPLASGQYIFNGCPSDGGDTAYRMQIRNGKKWISETGSGKTFTYDASTTDTDLVRINILNGAVCNNVVFKPMIRLASDTDASYEPYTNICPISGRTEVVTHRTGKNLLPYPYNEVTHKSNGVTFTVNDDGSVTANGTATALAYFHFVTRNVTGSLGFLKTGNYIASPAPQGASSTTFRYQVRANGTWVDVFTEQKEFSYVNGGGGLDAYSIRIESGATVNNVTFYPMLRLASETDDTYEPYNGNTYTTAPGRTVYGGTLDVVSGVLTVDRAYVDLGTLNWTYQSRGYFNGYTSHVQSEIKRPSDGAKTVGLVCSQYVEATTNQIYNGGVETAVAVRYLNGDIWVKDGRYTDAAAFKTAMNGVQLVYPLATPQTYQLTPQQIDLLLGTNHLWSDGEITVEYGVHPYYNPTPFASKPLIKVTGTGTLGIGEYILTITGTASQTLYIDCETMEIYTIEGTVPTGASSLVSINKNDFPVLEPGTNNISVGSGITAVTITPRWWRI